MHGPLPGAYEREARKGRVALFVEGDGTRWFVAGWADDRAARSKPEYHPFGQWFLLQRDPPPFELEPRVEPLTVTVVQPVSA